MLTKILIISIFVSGAFALSDECDFKRETCMPSGDPPEPPGTPEELNLFCNNTIHYLECTLELRSPCEATNSRGLRELREVISLLKQVCDKETDLYKDLEEVVPCLKSLVENKDMRCQVMYMQKDALEKFEKLLVSEGVTEAAAEYCLGTLFLDTCMLGSVGANCGPKARDVAVELLQMFTVAVEDDCFILLKGKLPDVVRAMELEYLESEQLEEIIQEE